VSSVRRRRRRRRVDEISAASLSESGGHLNEIGANTCDDSDVILFHIHASRFSPPS